MDTNYAAGVAAVSAAPAAASAAAAAQQQPAAAPADEQCQLCSSAGDGAAAAGTEPQCSHHHGMPAAAAGAPGGRASPFDALQVSSSSADISAIMPSPFGSNSHSLEVQPMDSTGRLVRRCSAGKHPSNLEHGSTAPPGAVDELAGKLLEAATRAAQAQQAAAGAGNAAARFAVPRRSAAASPAGQPSPELLNSQAALLAQQLLAQQLQVGCGNGTAAAHLRQSLEQPRPLGRSRTVAADELFGARHHGGAPSAADQLLGAAAQLLAGRSSGVFQRASGPLAGDLEPSRQPRYSAPTSPPSEEVSPFSAVQGEWALQRLIARPALPGRAPCCCCCMAVVLRPQPLLPLPPHTPAQASTAATCCHRPTLPTLPRPSPLPASTPALPSTSY